MKPWTVLVVDDLPSWIDQYVGKLEGWGLTIATARTLGELNAEYDRHRQDLVAIILDSCVPGNEVNTLNFITRVKADEFPGVLMAASSSSAHRQEMLKAGCTHQSSKSAAARHVLELLTNPEDN